MPAILGRAQLRFRYSIPVEGELAPLTVQQTERGLKAARVNPIVERGRLVGVHVEVQFDDSGIKIIGGRHIVVTNADLVLDPGVEAVRVLRSLLGATSILTLDANILADVDNGCEVTAKDWVLENGTLAGTPKVLGHFSWHIREEIQAATPVTKALWEALPGYASGTKMPLLWRSILMDAYRARQYGLAGAVVRAATSMEVGCTPHLSEVFNMDTLAKTNLGTIQPELYRTARELWFSRHGIVHHGQAKLLVENPRKGLPPGRDITGDDLRRFLAAVPEVVAYVESHPMRSPP